MESNKISLQKAIKVTKSPSVAQEQELKLLPKDQCIRAITISNDVNPRLEEIHLQPPHQRT
jgi:hypothetical protein